MNSDNGMGGEMKEGMMDRDLLERKELLERWENRVLCLGDGFVVMMGKRDCLCWLWEWFLMKVWVGCEGDLME